MKLYIARIVNDETFEEGYTSTAAKDEKEAEDNINIKLHKLADKLDYEQTYSIVDFYVVDSKVDGYKITLTKI